MLLRHSKAERGQPGGRDHERVLAGRGRDDAATLGVYLAKHRLVPDRVLVSTSARTRETWNHAGKAFPMLPTTLYDDRIYDASPQTILNVIRETDPQIGSLLVIGHNPGLHELAANLIATGDLETRERLNEAFPTSALAVIDFALDAWSRLHARGGRLERFVSPKLLAAATD